MILCPYSLSQLNFVCQLKNTKSLSNGILSNYMNGKLMKESFILRDENKCDQLLQEFHRFDEDLSVVGKWQGGSVTGVCRGWGTNKVRAVMSSSLGIVIGL